MPGRSAPPVHASTPGERLTGVLLGQALGDALGVVVEAEPAAIAAEYVLDWLLTGRAGERGRGDFPFGQYSDDTQLARELLISVRDAGEWSPAEYARRIAELFRDERDVGAGPGTRAAANRLLSGASWQSAGTPAPYAGNGSAMRAAPLGVLFAGEPDTMRDAAREQSLITHLDPRCSAGSVAVAGAVALAIEPGPVHPDSFLETLANWVGWEDGSVARAIAGVSDWLELDPVEAARQLHTSGLDPGRPDEWQGISAFVTPSVAWSIYAFLRTPDNYWETVCTAIGVGGDTDTIAAIAGAIAGARLGPSVLPQELLGRLHDGGAWTAAELAALAVDCAPLCR